MEAEIEEGLAHASEASFRYLLFENTPPSIILDYNEQTKTIAIRNSYELLVKEFTNGSNLLIVYPKEKNEIDISIMNVNSLKMVNIVKLEIGDNELVNFQKYIPAKTEISFYIHFAGVDYLMIDKKNKLIISEYKIAD